MKTITKLSAAVALAVGVSATAQAGTIEQSFIDIDVDGLGGLAGVTVEVLDFAPGNVLADGSLGAFTTGSDWNVYAQSKLSALNFGGSAVTPLGIDSDWEITTVLSFTESVTNSFDTGGTPFNELVILGFADTQVNNYFELWADSTPNADNLTGSGFNDGVLILSGTVTGIGTSNFTVDEDSLPGGANGPEDLDQSSDGDDWSGQQTLVGAGITSGINVAVGYFNTDYIQIDPLAIITFDLELGNVSQEVPYQQVNPSTCFVGAAGGTLMSACDANTAFTDGGTNGLNPELGATANGLDGSDFIFQTDFNASITVTPTHVPEPGSMALLGLGLTAMGFGAMRRRKKA